ncbi:MAG: Abi family protein [Clostridiales bacterium]|nr:Abi family protein [Clostridiales bacterium]
MSKTKTYAPVKPARSYAEQAKRLLDVHNLSTENEDRARHILSTVNYYRLTTYGKHLRRQDDPERFIDGVTLDDLYDLYQFDMGLRHQILPVLEFFEVQLRAKISYHLAMTYGSVGYTNAANFRLDRQSQGSHKSLMNKFRIEVDREDDLAFVRHHQTKYGGKFPIWAAVELFSFGMIAQLFDILTEEDQWAISKQYRLSPEELDALISAAVDVRNICAHYGRLYNQPMDDRVILLPKYAQYESDYVFPILLMLKVPAGGHRVYSDMIRGIAALEKEFPTADLSLCGFPGDWEDILRNL